MEKTTNFIKKRISNLDLISDIKLFDLLFTIEIPSKARKPKIGIFNRSTKVLFEDKLELNQPLWNKGSNSNRIHKWLKSRFSGGTQIDFQIPLDLCFKTTKLHVQRDFNENSEISTNDSVNGDFSWCVNDQKLIINSSQSSISDEDLSNSFLSDDIQNKDAFEVNYYENSQWQSQDLINIHNCDLRLLLAKKWNNSSKPMYNFAKSSYWDISNKGES